MPMVAVSEHGETLWPDDVEQDAFVGTCPECGGRLTVRRGHFNNGSWTVRHFWHSARAGRAGGNSGSQSRDCSGVSGSETNEHKLMKYVASRQLQQSFADDATITREKQIPDTDRVADVVADFERDIPRFGNGLIVECQYSNHTKPKIAVTMEYLNAGYSVIWAEERHFSSDWRSVNLPDATMPWPQMVPRKEEWRSYTVGQDYLSRMSLTRPPMRVNLPPEIEDDWRPVLRQHWERGDKGVSLNLEYELSANNATRQCEFCSETAEWYLLDFGRLSSYRCTTHHPTRGDTGSQDGGQA